MPSKSTILPKLSWERIQVILKPKTKPRKRELPDDETLRENKLQWMHYGIDRRNRLREDNKKKEMEFWDKISIEEREMKRQKEQKILEEAKRKFFLRDPCVKRFNNALEAQWFYKANEELINRQARKEHQNNVILQDFEENKMQKIRDSLKLDQEKLHQKRLDNIVRAARNFEEGKRVREVIEKMMHQDKEDTQEHQKNNEQHIKETKEKQIELKRDKMKKALEDVEAAMAERKYWKELEEQRVRKEEEQIELQKILHDKLEKRKTEFAEEDNKRRQAAIEHVIEKLSALNEKQEARKEKWQEKVLKKAEEEAEAKAAKQKIEKKQRREEMTKKERKIYKALLEENARRKMAEEDEGILLREAVFESDRLFALHRANELAQKRRKAENISAANLSLAAEKREREMKVRQEESEFVMNFIQQPAEKVEVLEQYVASEMAEAEKNGLNITRLKKLNLLGYGMIPSTGEDPGFGHRDYGGRSQFPSYNTTKTALVKHYQALRSVNKQFPLSELPPIELKPQKGLLVSGFLKNTNENETPQPSLQD